MFKNRNYWKESFKDLTNSLPEGAVDPKDIREELCEVMSKYKYLIIIDGHVSTWARSP